MPLGANSDSSTRAQVGLDNPAELKAAKLARSVTRGVLDRDARPDTAERARIAAVLQLPPNKCAPDKCQGPAFGATWQRFDRQTV